MQALAQACANLLTATDHVGRANNGLLGVWPSANNQGAWELGFKSHPNLRSALQNAGALYIAVADPAGDDPAYLGQTGFGGKAFVVVQDLFLTQTARLADVVLPAQSWVEREGTYTSGERRVQRFYRVLPDISKPLPRIESPGVNKASLLAAGEMVLEGPLADFTIPALISQRMGLDNSLNALNAVGVFKQISAAVPVFQNYPTPGFLRSPSSGQLSAGKTCSMGAPDMKTPRDWVCSSRSENMKGKALPN